MSEPLPNEPVTVDLRGDGLLWLINAAVLHPRGFALAVNSESGALSLLGDGSEPWMFAHDGTADAKFAAVEALFDRARAASIRVDAGDDA